MIDIMSAIWPAQFPSVSEKMLALCLADAAGPEGVTWLPIQSKRGKQDMMLKTQLSKRQIQRSLRSLEASGWIERFENPGRGCLIRVHKSPMALNSRGDTMSPHRGDTMSPHRGDTMSQGGDTMSPKPSNNRQLKKEGSGSAGAVDNLSIDRELPKSLEAWQWVAYQDVRRAIGKPLAATSARLLLLKLDAIEAEGWHIGDVVERATVNNWTDFHVPSPGRSTGVRRMIDGQVVKGPGCSEDEMEAARRIDALDDLNDRLAARAEFFAAAERTNSATSLGDLLGSLPMLSGRKGSKERTTK